MPNAKRNRRARRRREAGDFGVPSCAEWFVRTVGALLRRPRIPRTRSTRHLRNATIEMLEALRALLDEAIERLRETRAAELKRIRVEG